MEWRDARCWRGRFRFLMGPHFFRCDRNMFACARTELKQKVIVAQRCTPGVEFCIARFTGQRNSFARSARTDLSWSYARQAEARERTNLRLSSRPPMRFQCASPLKGTDVLPRL